MGTTREGKEALQEGVAGTTGGGAAGTTGGGTATTTGKACCVQEVEEDMTVAGVHTEAATSPASHRKYF